MATRGDYPLAKIACPVLTISAEDDRFGTTARARFVAVGAPNGKALIFPTSGHALVGHSGDALRETVSFLKALPPTPPW